MVNFYSADFILPATSEPIPNGTVGVGPDGSIIGVYPENSIELEGVTVERHKGVIVPGFINSHCHIELSHLRQQIPEKQGLISFIKEVIKLKKSAPSTKEAMEAADRQMWENGIVAVADVVNSIDSKEVKENSSIYYYTFVELLSFEPDRAKDVFRDGVDLVEKFSPLDASIVPHAPYSTSKELFRFIGKFCGESGSPLTIHNQESEDENKLYRYKTGDFLPFYKDLGINIDFFKPQARNSIQSIIPLIPVQQKTMLVHNTYTSLKDIYFILRSGRSVTWCFCPNANLYIENRLPKIEMFQYHDFNITVGTDSLASNKHLCILSELKTLHKNFPALSLAETIGWATINGAKFLGIEDKFGSIEKGKKPGLNLITQTSGLKLSTESKVQKLI